MLRSKTKSFIAAIALSLAMSLVWTLSTQDLVDVYNVGADIDLPEMAAVDAPDLVVLPDVTPKPPPPPVRLPKLVTLRAPSIVMITRQSDAFGLIAPSRMHWLVNSPQTAPPLV
jgi:hypothetical protein